MNIGQFLGILTIIIATIAGLIPTQTAINPGLIIYLGFLLYYVAHISEQLEQQD